MMLNSAQHARSAASRLDDVIDRSALEQAREGLGGRDTEEAAHLDSERKIRKITFEVRGRRSPRNYYGDGPLTSDADASSGGQREGGDRGGQRLSRCETVRHHAIGVGGESGGGGGDVGSGGGDGGAGRPTAYCCPAGWLLGSSRSCGAGVARAAEGRR